MLTTQPRIAWLKPEEYAGAISRFDEEFILSRGRTISLAQRFSDVFAGDCLIIAANVEQQIVAALIVCPFVWVADGREWQGAMIGAVCTDRRHRGRGIAARLLAAAEQRCRELGHEFMVLWAADHRLYERMGWMTADCGMLGRGAGSGIKPADDLGAGPAPVDKIIQLREALGGNRVKRVPGAYWHLLPPAECLRHFIDGTCYAVVGSRAHTGYIYELAEDVAGMPQLWSQLSRCYCDLYINVQQDSAAHRWLRQHTRVAWSPQALTMWKPLQKVAVSFGQWYIPFLDRI